MITLSPIVSLQAICVSFGHISRASLLQAVLYLIFTNGAVALFSPLCLSTRFEVSQQGFGTNIAVTLVMQLEIMKNIPKRSEGIQQRDLVDGCMLLDQERAVAFALNVTASLMWSHCDGQHTIEEIAKIIAETSSLPADHIIEDVKQTFKNFHAHGLLYFVGP